GFSYFQMKVMSGKAMITLTMADFCSGERLTLLTMDPNERRTVLLRRVRISVQNYKNGFAGLAPIPPIFTILVIDGAAESMSGSALTMMRAALAVCS
ncbi:hypothetical protein PENTCL1PPCAC_7231, partial [Pristionchus entomophagus]